MQRQLLLAGVAAGLVRPGHGRAVHEAALTLRVERAAVVVERAFRGIVKCEAVLDAGSRTVRVTAQGYDHADGRSLLRHLRSAWSDELRGTGLRVLVQPGRQPAG